MPIKRDPAVLERCRKAGAEYSRAEMEFINLRKHRDAVIQEAHRMGFGYRRISSAMGISVSRVQQIVSKER